MLNLFTLLIIRAAILFAGAIFCWAGGFNALSFATKTHKVNLTNFLKILANSVILLGLTMFLIAVGNIMVYFFPNTGSYVFLVSAGLVGIASIFAFIYSFWRIHNYVVVK